jgi:hypothetical protein
VTPVFRARQRANGDSRGVHDWVAVRPAFHRAGTNIEAVRRAHQATSDLLDDLAKASDVPVERAPWRICERHGFSSPLAVLDACPDCYLDTDIRARLQELEAR